MIVTLRPSLAFRTVLIIARVTSLLTIGFSKDIQSIRLTSIGSSSLTDWSYSDARTSHLCMTLGEQFTRRILIIVHRCQNRFIELVIPPAISGILRYLRLCGRQIASITVVKSCALGPTTRVSESLETRGGGAVVAACGAKTLKRFPCLSFQHVSFSDRLECIAAHSLRCLE